ncbi:hypothetical protein E1B28_000797 [Marasmius oreades]|uniref:Uncharacterized protein n=1 Tax=Marasmius oreades TaxID=181124 RepID=A0A9P7V287_9AGAR|nr:uncharacterized protein E1B28_000797 [Marasmius oreades]KAG7098897.1 hypothetical protein E1B28_000797 [Marasmius oreades]
MFITLCLMALSTYGTALREMRTATSGTQSRESVFSLLTQLPFYISTDQVPFPDSTPVTPQLNLSTMNDTMEDGGAMLSSSEDPTAWPDDSDTHVGDALDANHVQNKQQWDLPPHMSHSSHNSQYVTHSEISTLTDTIKTLILTIQNQHSSNGRQDNVTLPLQNSSIPGVHAPYPGVTPLMKNSPGLGMCHELNQE